MNHRFLVDHIPAAGAMLTLPEAEARHARVVRVRDGEAVELLDGRGTVSEARVASITGGNVTIEVGPPIDAREPSIRVTLGLALIQPERFEMAIQKATELGASRFSPLITEEIEVRPERILGKLDRWQRIAAEAAKQCGRGLIPQVENPQTLQEFLARASGPLLIFEAEGAPLEPLAEEGEVSLLIGPEGGWSASEIEMARSAGARVATLGQRRLRAETAAIVSVAALIHP